MQKSEVEARSVNENLLCTVLDRPVPPRALHHIHHHHTRTTTACFHLPFNSFNRLDSDSLAVHSWLLLQHAAPTVVNVYYSHRYIHIYYSYIPLNVGQTTGSNSDCSKLLYKSRKGHFYGNPKSGLVLIILTTSSCVTAPLKLRPYGAIQMSTLLLLL